MKYLFTLSVFFVSMSLCAQITSVPPLERTVTLSAENESVESVLEDISSQAGFIFSYSPGLINTQRVVTFSATDKPVRLVLLEILDESVSYKTKGKYVIIKKNEGDDARLEGYLYDSATGLGIGYASIYNKSLMASVVTDKYGYFSIDLSSVPSSASLYVSKAGYTDTTIMSAPVRGKRKPVEMTLVMNDSLAENNDAEHKRVIPDWLIPGDVKANSLNIKEAWPKSIQLSFLPGVSTNKLFGGNIDNNVSVNMLGGYTKSVRYFEIGGLFNMVKNNSGVCQLSGVTNLVGGNSSGLQMAGVMNSVGGRSSGVQVAGVYNATTAARGVQIGGILNTAREESDIQMAGIANYTVESRLQLSGIANSSAHSAGTQVSGIVNFTDTASVQISGVVNKAGVSRVLQLSLVNIADSSDGVVIGLINVADTSGGINVGLINIVRHGYHKFEISADEMFQANIAFRGGTRSFHSMVSAGVRLFNHDMQVWGLGYGIGTTIGKSLNTTYDIEISSSGVFYNDDLTSENQLHRLYFGIDHIITDKFSFAAGLSFNMLVTDKTGSYYSDVYSDIAPYNVLDISSGTTDNYECWVGAKLALRFF